MSSDGERGEVFFVVVVVVVISVRRLRERGRMSKSVYVRVVLVLELLRYVLRCAIERYSFNFPLG